MALCRREADYVAVRGGRFPLDRCAEIGYLARGLSGPALSHREYCMFAQCCAMSSCSAGALVTRWHLLQRVQHQTAERALGLPGRISFQSASPQRSQLPRLRTVWRVRARRTSAADGRRRRAGTASRRIGAAGVFHALVSVAENGIPLSKIHHAAFDAHLIGIDPDYRLHVSERLLVQQDGPMLEALERLHGGTLHLPARIKEHPDRDRLAERFERFLAAA